MGPLATPSQKNDDSILNFYNEGTIFGRVPGQWPVAQGLVPWSLGPWDPGALATPNSKSKDFILKSY